MNTQVSFSIAKLLKEKGFDKPTNLLYQLNGTLHTVIPNSDYPHLKVHNNKEIDSYTNGFLNWNGLDLDEDERLDLYSGFNERYEDAFSVCCTTPTIVDGIIAIIRAIVSGIVTLIQAVVEALLTLITNIVNLF